MRSALLIIDLLQDFVGGAAASGRAGSIVPAARRLLDAARPAGVPVVFCNDAHDPGRHANELALFGPHALIGTPGAELVPELALAADDLVVAKGRYSAFFDTGLEALLRQRGVQHLLLAGVQANVCVQHTAADAFFRGFPVTVIADAIEARSKEDLEAGLSYMRRYYGADVQTVDRIVEQWTGTGEQFRQRAAS